MAALRSAVAHERAQDAISGVVVASVRRLWQRMRGRRWETAWQTDVGPQVVAVIGKGQAAAAARADQYAAEALAELDMPVGVPTSLSPDAFVGVAGDGRSVEGLTYGAVVRAAKAQYSPDLVDLELEQRSRAALAQAERWIAEITEGILADTVRAAEVTSMAERPWVDGWVRVIEPGACSRCAVLAGKFYLFNEGFDRHPPTCRCTHAPAPSDPDRRRALMETESPERYFESLAPAEQDKIFTVAGAEAIRLGADIGQVVNARRGMSTAQTPSGRNRLAMGDVYGRQVYVTTEGTTRRGFAYTRLTTRQSRADDTRRVVDGRRQRVASTRSVRLMPESILQIAGDDPAERIRLLTLHGYVL